jgi:hypothetical protein
MSSQNLVGRPHWIHSNDWQTPLCAFCAHPAAAREAILCCPCMAWNLSENVAPYRSFSSPDEYGQITTSHESRSRSRCEQCCGGVMYSLYVLFSLGVMWPNILGTMRWKVQARFGVESDAAHFCAQLWCPCCALAQIYRERTLRCVEEGELPPMMCMDDDAHFRRAEWERAGFGGRDGPASTAPDSLAGLESELVSWN